MKRENKISNKFTIQKENQKESTKQMNIINEKEEEKTDQQKKNR
jgi:hypothetical protein